MKAQLHEGIRRCHQKAHYAYDYSTQGCAVAYAICEFTNLHILLIVLSGGLIVSLVTITLAALTEKVL